MGGGGCIQNFCEMVILRGVSSLYRGIVIIFAVAQSGSDCNLAKSMAGLKALSQGCVWNGYTSG